MLNRISEIHDLGFQFSFNWDKYIYIEVSYTEAIKDIMYDPTTGQVIRSSSFGGSPPLSFVSSQSTKPILTFKMEPDDINFNFVKENLESILNVFTKIFLDWYNLHINDIPEILSNFDDKRILRDVEKKVCRLVKLKNLTN